MAVKVTTYDKPLKATYHFKIYEYGSAILIPAWVSCYVLAETEKRYQIQIQAPIPRHAAWDKMWVSKQFVKLAN